MRIVKADTYNEMEGVNSVPFLFLSRFFFDKKQNTRQPYWDVVKQILIYIYILVNIVTWLCWKLILSLFDRSLMVVDGSRSNHLDSVLSPKNCCLIAELFPDLVLQRMERYVFMFDFCICQCQNRYQIDAGHPKDLIYSSEVHLIS